MPHKLIVDRRKLYLYAGGGAVVAGGIWLLTRKGPKLPVPGAAPTLKRYGLVDGTDRVISAIKRWDFSKTTLAEARVMWERTLAFSQAARQLLVSAASELDQIGSSLVFAMTTGPAMTLATESITKDFRQAAVALEGREADFSTYLAASVSVERYVGASQIILGRVRSAFSALEAYQQSLFPRLLRLVNVVGDALEATLRAALKVIESAGKLAIATAGLVEWFPHAIIAGGIIALGIWAYRSAPTRSSRLLPE